MSIYTRTGDKGKTSLFSGQRVSKADLRVEAYGTVDELNSAIGVAIAEISNIIHSTSSGQISNIKKELVQVQKDLFEIGSALAQAGIRNLDQRVKDFEKMIDEMTGKLPPLQNFILPGGGGAGSTLHFARTVCRRAERRVVALSKKEKISADIIVYLNRLSDLLFTMAR
ncbi:MAG: cob(I)yrinic acid a,c-diamide adenosyltransferase, partial [bacterium]|nr:cob(I)yrinic acid a,c-diamide adenosyltransferase [bacterium]